MPERVFDNNNHKKNDENLKSTSEKNGKLLQLRCSSGPLSSYSAPPVLLIMTRIYMKGEIILPNIILIITSGWWWCRKGIKSSGEKHIFTNSKEFKVLQIRSLFWCLIEGCHVMSCQKEGPFCLSFLLLFCFGKINTFVKCYVHVTWKNVAATEFIYITKWVHLNCVP